VRCYGLTGGGVMRSRIEGFGRLGPESKTQGAVDIGGGIMYARGGRVFGRVEYRRVTGVQAGTGAWATVDAWTFDRLTAGIGLTF
jgi:hypothetical protein